MPNGIIAHDGLLNPGANVRQRGQRRNVRNEEEYRLTFQTHQKNVQSLRLDAFTDKSLPQRGPGLSGDGSFQLTEITVTARPGTGIMLSSGKSVPIFTRASAKGFLSVSLASKAVGLN